LEAAIIGNYEIYREKYYRNSPGMRCIADDDVCIILLARNIEERRRSK
jgi:hypothetical protein